MSDESHKLVISQGEHSALCGWKNWNQATEDDEAVTCRRCLKKMQSSPPKPLEPTCEKSPTLVGQGKASFTYQIFATDEDGEKRAKSNSYDSEDEAWKDFHARAPKPLEDWSVDDDAHMDAQGGMGSYDPARPEAVGEGRKV